jgi:hypothetical protein
MYGKYDEGTYRSNEVKSWGIDFVEKLLILSLLVRFLSEAYSKPLPYSNKIAHSA